MVVKSKKFKILFNFDHFWSLGAPDPNLGSLMYSPLKYLQNEANPRLLTQSVQELLRKQGELPKNEGPPHFLQFGG